MSLWAAERERKGLGAEMDKQEAVAEQEVPGQQQLVVPWQQQLFVPQQQQLEDVTGGCKGQLRLSQGEFRGAAELTVSRLAARVVVASRQQIHCGPARQRWAAEHTHHAGKEGEDQRACSAAAC